MTPILIIWVVLGGVVEVEKIDFRTLESCEIARAEIERDLMRLHHSAQGGQPVSVIASCIDRSVVIEKNARG